MFWGVCTFAHDIKSSTHASRHLVAGEVGGSPSAAECEFFTSLRGATRHTRPPQAQTGPGKRTPRCTQQQHPRQRAQLSDAHRDHTVLCQRRCCIRTRGFLQLLGKCIDVASDFEGTNLVMTALLAGMNRIPTTTRNLKPNPLEINTYVGS